MKQRTKLIIREQMVEYERPFAGFWVYGQHEVGVHIKSAVN